MELAIFSNLFKGRTAIKENINTCGPRNLTHAGINVPCVIKEIKTDDKQMVHFLFTLGCFEGEKITVISVLAENYVISVKDARYSIDEELAKAILI